MWADAGVKIEHTAKLEGLCVCVCVCVYMCVSGCVCVYTYLVAPPQQHTARY